MFQTEIEIDALDSDRFDTVFWHFCADRLASQPEPIMQCQSFNMGRSERRTIAFQSFEDATAYRRQWSLFVDARIDWDLNSIASTVLGLVDVRIQPHRTKSVFSDVDGRAGQIEHLFVIG